MAWGSYKDFIKDNWLGKRTGRLRGCLIKGYGWLNAKTGKIEVWHQ